MSQRLILTLIDTRLRYRSTPTNSTKGGVLIYVKSGLNFKLGTDLYVYKDNELKSLFIEILKGI